MILEAIVLYGVYRLGKAIGKAEEKKDPPKPQAPPRPTTLGERYK